MDERIKLLIATLGEHRVKLSENLKYHTYLKIDAVAEYFYIVTKQNELVEILNAGNSLKIPLLIFGNGTKLVLDSDEISGMVVKNRTGNIKIGGIKGKVGVGGIGVEEALLELDSGVSLDRLNDFLVSQKLKKIDSYSSGYSTIGGAIFLDPVLQNMSTKIKIWYKGEIQEVGSEDLDRQMVVLSVVIKAKAEV